MCECHNWSQTVSRSPFFVITDNGFHRFNAPETSFDIGHTPMNSTLNSIRAQADTAHPAPVFDDLIRSLHFAPGIDWPSKLAEQQLAELAQYLMLRPKLKIGLVGHTDIRGSDEYNNVLSKERALSVKALLVAYGVAESRIQTAGAGSQFARAPSGDGLGYAKDRRVSIQLLSEPVSATVF